MAPAVRFNAGVSGGESANAPRGWCRFPLRKRSATDALDNWHVAFYGTRIPMLRRILDRGELVMFGEDPLLSYIPIYSVYLGGDIFYLACSTIKFFSHSQWFDPFRSILFLSTCLLYTSPSPRD